MTIRTSMLVLCMAAATQQALAATVSFQWFGGRLTTAAEIANDPSLANQLVHDFRVTTSADILRVGDVRIHGGVHPYNNSFGTDVEPPNPLFLPVFPALGADSWITTPSGVTAFAGNAADPLGTENNHWFDTTNDGPQNNFLFARLTMPRGYLSFAGVVSVLGDSGDPEVHPFFFIEPEPCSSTLALWAAAALAFTRGGRRR